jgi:ATP-dependent Clp protease ATP-binding subunit ClpA
VLLFDEIEKAHPDVLNALLQVLDAGRMTDNHGRSVDFRNTLIIMTSNLGTTDATGQTRESRENATAEALRSLRPEFRNRIDEVVLFDPLTLAEANGILDIYLAELRDTLGASESDLTVTRPARAALLAEGFNELTGARPLRATLERRVIGPLSRELLARSWAPGDQVSVRYSNGKYRLRRAPRLASAAEPPDPDATEREILSSDSLMSAVPSPLTAVSLQEPVRGTVGATSAVERPAYLERDPGI